MPVENVPIAAPAAPAAAEGAAAPAPAARVDRIAVARAKALEAVKAAPPAAAPAPATPPGGAPPAAKAEIATDPETLRTLTKLSRENREAKARMAELEAKAPAASKWAEAEAAIKDGKSLKALGLLGIDVNRVVTEAMEADPEASKTEAVDKVAEELLALKKTVEADKAATEAAEKDRQTRAAAASLEASRKVAVETMGGLLKDGADRWHFGSRVPDTAADAVEEAAAAARLIMYGSEPKKDDKGAPVAVRGPFSDDEARKLMEAALDTLEEKHRARAKLYGAPEPPARRRAASPQTSSRPESRQPPPTIDSPRGPTPEAATQKREKLTAREAQRRAVERAGGNR